MIFLPKSALRLSRNEVWSLTGFFLVWRLSLFFLASLAGKVLPYQPSFPYYDSLLPATGFPQWLYSWANFDGVHYLTIVQKGYLGTGLIQAFFPGYPLLVFLINGVVGRPLLSALLVANLAAYGFVLVWFWWLKTDFSVRIAWIGTLILFLFPMSFFLGATYGESLALLTMALSFLAARWRWWWLAGLMALVASATRVVGIILVPALLIELVQQIVESSPPGAALTPRQVLNRLFERHRSALAGILLGILGLGSYMVYLKTVFHDALYFLHVQSEFGAGREERLVLYPQVVWRYFKILATYRPHDWKFFSLIQEAVIGMGGLIGLLVSSLKIRYSYVVFSLGIFLIPTFTGTFSSLPRYLLPCFSLWMLLALALSRVKPWVLVLFLLCSALLLIINLWLFTQGYWVA